MEISNITSNYQNNTTAVSQDKSAEKKSADVAESTSQAVVYEKTEERTTDTTKQIYQRDNATIEQLKADAERRTQQLRNLVEKLLTKPGKTFTEATDMFQLIKNGELEVDEETRKQAQEDISENGYWGVEQTSERMVSFAIALSGGDTSKADTLMEAIRKGYEDATSEWGDELPEICKKTLEAVEEKMEAWKNGTYPTQEVETDASTFQ